MIMDYKEKLQEAKRLYESANADQKYVLESLFPELAGSEDEQIRKELTKHLKEGVEGYMPAGDSSDYRRWLDWLEKQGKSSDQIHYWTEEEIEPIISDYLRGAEHYGGMIGRLRCLKPKSLENQGEQKPAIEMKTPEESLGIDSDTYNEIVDECIYGEQKSQRMISAEAKEAMYGKPSDKVEPKFKVGDWVVYYRNDSSREVLQVYDIRDGRYYFTDNVHFSWSVKECDEKSHLWTIQDAKDGDVLYCENSGIEYIVMNNGINKCNNIDSYFEYNSEDGFDIGVPSVLSAEEDIITPATNEQRDTLMKAMADAGYTFDFDKRELKKIEQKSAEWSEEDENILSNAIFFIREYQTPTRDKTMLNAAKEAEDWLKSLKQRIGG